MEESKAKDCGEDNESENTKKNFGKENFRMYYALGPELEQGNSLDYEGSDTEDFTQRKYEYFTSDFEEDSDNVIHVHKEQQRRGMRVVIDVKDEELSDDSGTVDDKEWKGSSIPPDVVASAKHLKVIRVEPRQNLSNIDGDLGKRKQLFNTEYDQDITDFKRHQVEAYTNLEDLLDEPWEESDFAPPFKVESNPNLSMGVQGRRRIKLIQKAGLDPAQYQCGPLCNNCSIM